MNNKTLTLICFILLTCSVFGCDVDTIKHDDHMLTSIDTTVVEDTTGHSRDNVTWDFLNKGKHSFWCLCVPCSIPCVAPKQPLRMKIDTVWAIRHLYKPFTGETIKKPYVLLIDTTYYLTPEQVELLGGVK